MKRCFSLILVVGLCLIPVDVVLADGWGEGEVVRISFTSRAELAQVTARLDVWEVHPDAGYLVAHVTSDDQAWLAAQGFAVEPVRSPAPHLYPHTIPDYPCYRTIAELYDQLSHWETLYPDLVDLMTVGYSYEGRPLQVMHLTSHVFDGDKPVFFLMANIHGRELITNEAAMVFVQYLLERYGTDPDVTWLLDYRSIYVMVSANPDGHVKNEAGQPWAYWRKNTNPTYGCPGGSYGVDLNRNSGFEWGGASTDPCAETYQGPAPVSEPETEAIQNFVRSIFPDQRGPGDGDAAPDEATGVFITLHSYSNLVLWPWGYTSLEAPNATQLERLGRKLAAFNGYRAQQSSDFYPTTGTTDDWSYGELGIASYTFEIGSGEDGFYPPCSRYDALIQPNLPAFLYAARVSRTPYVTPFGPDVHAVAVTPTGTLRGGSFLLRATINADGGGGNDVTHAEYYADAPPWAGGSGGRMEATDGAFDSGVEAVEASVSTAGWSPGRHVVLVRGQEATGYWGALAAAFVEVHAPGTIAGHVSDAHTGAPIAGAGIRIAGGGQRVEATTDERGYYAAPVLSATYTVTATAVGYQSQSVGGIVATTGLTTTQDFSLLALPRLFLPFVAREASADAHTSP